MNTETELSLRQEIIDQTRREDERSDLKQHADKMLRDFEKFNDFSSNRAIWELVQNACDLTTQADIIIDYQDNKISFSHNGKPFTTKALISLIKQVSGKYGEQEEKEDIPEVGKYGTGFLTTHTFGRKFIIDSVLEANGTYFPIDNFLIDRSPKEWVSLSDNISDQKKLVYDLIKNGNVVLNPIIQTKFTYLPATENEINYIKKSFSDLEEYIPLVFTINDRINTITIIALNGEKTFYQLQDKKPVNNNQQINLFKTTILKNYEEISIFSIIDKDEQIEIILPVNKNNQVFEFSDRVARLFLYYPLVGSEDFGINFIINCKNFSPTEPRNGIHLNSDKDQVAEQEESNRKILDKCTELIFLFLNSNVIQVSNPLLYTHVNFKTNTDEKPLNEYFEKLQKQWNEKLKLLPFVNTLGGYKNIKEAIYFSEDFWDQDENLFNAFYELASKFFTNIPVKDEILKWSNNARNWNDNEISFITHDILLQEIRKCNLNDFNKETLITYYQYLISIGQSGCFGHYNLIPNIDGEFKNLGNLLIAKDLNPTLINLGKILIPDFIGRIIHFDFTFDFTLTPFNRRNFSDEVKNTLDQKNLSESVCYPENLNINNYHQDLLQTKHQIEGTYFRALFDFCKMVNNVEFNSKPKQLLKEIANYYGFDSSLIHLPKLREDIENLEYRSSRKTLVKIFLNLISLHNNDWVEKNQLFFNNICSLNDDSYKEAYKDSKIYPNQLFELYLAEDLKRDLGVYDDIKNIYLKVKREDINEKLSLKSFNSFITESNTIDNRSLTVIIENILFTEDVNNIDEHSHKETILKIIPNLTTKEYQLLFPQLNDKKASIMISVVTKEETKDDIFAIVTLQDEKLKKIGQLIQKENFEDLLDRAERIFEDEKQSRSNFEHKYEIGVYIENKVRESINSSLNSLVTIDNPILNGEIIPTNEQGGQDIIIRVNNQPVYYIEVKSRWNSKSSVTMSKLQLEKAVTYKNNYSLCAVDITNYSGAADRYTLPVEEVLPLGKFVNNIGEYIEPLIEKNLLAEQEEDDNVHLIDYRGIIPQNIIKEGYDFDSFIKILLKHINQYSLENAITI